MGSFTLNFDKNRLITGVNIVDNILYFTDNETEPKRINLEVFKAADHSNGTTSVYGRQFLERDITVIRPHPQAVINSNLSQEVDIPIDAVEPLVLTGAADVFNDFVKLNGSAINAGTVFVKRGFYYREYISGATPSLETVISEGTKVESDLNGFGFSSEVSLSANKKYHYVAYAKSQIGSAIYGDVVAFKTNAITVDFPSVTTVGHEKLSNLSYRLKGKVTDQGGSQVTEVGIYYYFLDFLNSSTPPSTLVGNSNNAIANAYKRTASYNIDTGEFFIDIAIPPASIFYYQAYAVNVESGQDEGLVKNQLVAVTEAPEVQLEDCEIFNNKAILRAKVTRANGNLIERGFYFSKTSNNLFTMVATHATDPNIFKVSVPMTPNTSLDAYLYDTIAESGLSLTRGDTLYVAAYASNGAERQTGILPLTIRNAEIDPPSVSTNGVEIVDNNGNSRLRCTGYNNAPDYQSVQSLGFYITRNESGKELGVDQAAKKAEMIRRFNASPSTATEIISQKLSGFISQPNTDIGLFVDSFDGNNEVPLEPGYDYYVMAIAFNGGVLGTGDVVNTPTKTEADAPPVYTRQTNPATLTSGTMRGTVEFDDDPTVKVALDDAGFTYAAGESGSLKIAHISISSGDLATLNTFVTTGVGSGDFSVTKTGLQQNTLYKVQAYVTPSGGSKVYAKFDNDEQGTYGDGITRFRTLKPTTTLPKLTATLKTTQRTTAKVRGNLTNDGGSGMSLQAMQPVFYYATKAITVGSTDAQKIANIITQVGTNQPTATIGKLSADFDFNQDPPNPSLANEAFVTIGGAQEHVVSSTSTPLLNNTEYYFFMSTTVSNGAGTTSSNLNEFKTLAPVATTPIINPVVVSNIAETNVWVGATVISSGGNADYHNRTVGFYYIKKSDLPASYDPNNGLTAATSLIADADKAFAAQARFGGVYLGSKNLTSLEPNTEYYVIAAVENNVGVGYSTKATLFKTKGVSVPDSISINGLNTFWFDKNGRAIDENTVSFTTTPSTASVTAIVQSHWSPSTGGARVPSVILERSSSGGTLLTIDCPENNSRSAREIYITLAHSLTPGVTRKIKIIQQAGSGSGFDDGDGPDIDAQL